MSKLVIIGGTPLNGTLKVPGAKNAVLPILAATLLSEKPVRLLNCPRLADVRNMLQILRKIGCKADWEGDVLCIDPSDASCHVMPEQLSKELRSSIFLLGPVLSRLKKAVVTYPGGCEIGNRPIDLHLSGLAALNVSIRESHGNIFCDGTNMKGAAIHLDYPSVGATENVMMAAVKATGSTVINNAAREPEIVDLQNFLNTMGYCVRGAGSSTIHVQCAKAFDCETEYTIMPDRIDAGTFLCAAAMTRGDIELHNVVIEHVSGVLSKLSECGCHITTGKDTVRIKGPKHPNEIARIETLPYPGFPTDMQAQMFALCSVAKGTSTIIENVFENRFKHAAELARMGAVCMVKDRTAVIRGTKLMGAQVTARDLRGGAALVLAGLCAEGCTQVDCAEFIDRGYEAFEQRLAHLGANIYRQTE